MSTLNEAKLIRMCIFLHFAEQLYNEMIEKSKMKDLDYYSAHFVSLQKKFVKDQESIVKNLIRLVKYWRKTYIEDKSSDTARLPSSYPLELITIGCWENAGKPLPFDIRAGFKALLQQLAAKDQIHFIWYNYYNEAMAKSGIKMMNPAGKRFVCVPVQGKLQASPKPGRAHTKAMGVIPLRVLK